MGLCDTCNGAQGSQPAIGVADVAVGLAASFPVEDGKLFAELVRQLANGRPTSRPALAAALGWPGERVEASLARVRSVEFEGESIVGAGLTLRPTPHVFEIDHRRLYTWCALDALMFPAIIGKICRVVSPCAMTGTPVSVTVSPDRVLDCQPQEAMVSVVLPDLTNLRESFCDRVRFFGSASVAESWVASREAAVVMSVRQAFCLGQDLARHLCWVA